MASQSCRTILNTFMMTLADCQVPGRNGLPVLDQVSREHQTGTAIVKAPPLDRVCKQAASLLAASLRYRLQTSPALA